MSQKFNSKNLSYNSSIPPFLAALKAQASSSSSAPNPLLAGQRRHGVKRSASADAEDAPLIVDEEGNVVDAQVGQDGTVTVSREGAEAEEEVGDGSKVENEGSKSRSGVVSAIGRKRKTAKVIGANADGDDPEASAPKSSKVKAEKGDKTDDKKQTMPKKKAKKIKLSFDEDAG
ncbi:hypothetical protein jhhlp_000119 [Lomentospora prolificans]|uniref:DUF4604 domain-containing protein n=1 Tax=Lomentospora prolificans TaxID=41688 RepID=A0A2N3NLR4_9PEZI|nr:hypothetical protein jhhlp_000119 [Lomentospora prolificans]